MNYKNKYLKYKLKYLNLKKKFNGGMYSNQETLPDLQKIEDQLISVSDMITILENNKCDCLKDIQDNINTLNRQEELNQIEEDIAALILKKIELQQLNTQAIARYEDATRGPGSPPRSYDVEPMRCNTPEKSYL